MSLLELINPLGFSVNLLYTRVLFLKLFDLLFLGLFFFIVSGKYYLFVSSMGSMSLKKSYFVVLFANFEKGTGDEY